MANVPYAEGIADTAPDTRVPDDYSRLNVDPSAFGGAIAQGEQQLGAGTLNAAKFWGSVQTDKVMNDTLAQGDKIVSQYKGLRGQDALHAQADMQSQLNQVVKTGRESLVTPEQQLQFDQQVRPYQQRYWAGQISTHANDQAYHVASTVNNDAYTLAVGRASNASVYSNADELKHAYGDAFSARLKQLQVDGMENSPEAKATAANQALKDVVKTAAQSMLVADPIKAQQFVESYKDKLGTEYAPLAEAVRTRANEKIGSDFGTADFTKRMQDRQTAGVVQAGAPPLGATGDAAAVLRNFEGFKPQAYWDVNHWRAGYGSDTITQADGSVVPVTAMTQVTRDDAERDLQRRVQQTQGQVQSTIGAEAWTRLSPSARASITSVAYNYGRVPTSLAQAAQSGDPVTIAQAINGLGGANGGVNSRRRAQEAGNVLGTFGLSGPEATAAAPSMTMPASLSGEPTLLSSATSPAFAAPATTQPLSPPPVPPTLEEAKSSSVQAIQNSDLLPEQKAAAMRAVAQQYNATSEMSAGLLSTIEQSQKQIASGLDVPQATWDSVRSRVKASGLYDVQQQFDTADQIRNTLKFYKGQSPNEVAASVQAQQAAMRQGGATPQQIQVAQASANYYARLTHDINTDPLARATQDGVVTGIAPLNLQANPRQFADAFALRIPQAERVAQFYNRPVEFLTPAERDAFKDLSSDGGAKMQAMTSAVINQLGPSAGAFFSEVGGAAPQFAHMGRLKLLGADTSTLSDLSAFQRISQDKEASKQILKLPEATIQVNAQSEYKSAFAAMPEFASNARSAAQKLLEIRALRNGTDPKDASKADVDRAFQEAAGAKFDGNVQYGGVGRYKPSFWSSGQNVPLPPGVRADQFGDVVSAVRDADVVGSPPVAGDLKTPIPMASVAKGNLVAASHGSYWVAMGDPLGRDPQWVMGKDGRKFVLDLNALAPALRDRVPAAYGGGTAR